MQNQQLFFIAIVCPEPLQTDVTSIKNYFFEKYNCKVALKSPAHITLIPPFELKHIHQHELTEFLSFFNSTAGLLSISIKGFNHFEKRTIFLQPENNSELFKLQTDLAAYLKFKQLHLKVSSHFHPHITVANRDITPADFDDAWQTFKNKEFKASFQSEKIALLKLTEKKWNVIEAYKWKQQ